MKVFLSESLRWRLIILAGSFFGAGITLPSSLTISTPGHYLLGADARNSSGATSIIRISSSNVIVDLADHIISADATIGVSGIVIDTGLTNVVIKNGTIRGSTGSGIVVNSNCSQVAISGIQFERCAGVALDLNRLTDSIVHDCSFTECPADSGTISIIALLRCQRVAIASCTISRVTVPNPSGRFYCALNDCVDCDFTDVMIVDNADQAPTFFYLESCQTIRFDRCAVLANTLDATGDGFSFFDTSRCVVNECVVMNQIAQGSFDGFSLADSANNSFNNCVVENCQSVGDFLHGFRMRGRCTNTALQNCLVRNNSARSFLFGYYVETTIQLVMNACQAVGNSCQSGRCAGYFCEEPVSDCSLIDCYFISNKGDSTANSFGINSQTPKFNNLYFRTIAFENGTIAANQLRNLPTGSVTIPAAPETDNLAPITFSGTNIAVPA
jgi:parallel beta-helix repeat protein